VAYFFGHPAVYFVKGAVWCIALTLSRTGWPRKVSQFPFFIKNGIENQLMRLEFFLQIRM